MTDHCFNTEHTSPCNSPFLNKSFYFRYIQENAYVLQTVDNAASTQCWICILIKWIFWIFSIHFAVFQNKVNALKIPLYYVNSVLLIQLNHSCHRLQDQYLPFKTTEEPLLVLRVSWTVLSLCVASIWKSSCSCQLMPLRESWLTWLYFAFPFFY